MLLAWQISAGIALLVLSLQMTSGIAYLLFLWQMAPGISHLLLPWQMARGIAHWMLIGDLSSTYTLNTNPTADNHSILVTFLSLVNIFNKKLLHICPNTLKKQA